MRILWSIMRKEFIHIRNDLQTLLIVFLFPILMLFLYGYAITFEMRNISTAVNDLNNTVVSRQFVEKLEASNFFKIQHRTGLTDAEVVKLFQQGTARCVIVIPRDFGSDRYTPAGAKLQVLVDASDPNAATLIQNYLSVVIQRQFKDAPPLVSVEPRFLYNPEQRSAIYFVPGLIAIIVILISALLTSIAITKEKESGTFEQMLVSPVKSREIILGKLIPYLLIAFASSLLVLGLGVLVFRVPCVGSLLFLLAMLLVYILVGLSLGLLISTIVKTQQVAMMLTLVATILPTMMLSGFIFPIESMPKIFQYITFIVPARHFIIIIRGIMLKGNDVYDVLQPMLILIGMTAFLLLVSVKKFKANLG